MSLTYTFAKALNAVGVHPPSLFNDQLCAAIDADDARKTQQVIAANNDVAGSIRTMFARAVVYSKFSAATAIVQLVPDVMTKDYSEGEDFINRTILMQRCISGNGQQVGFLIRQGADVKAKDDNGFTALHFAAAHGHLDSIDPLVNAGADVNAVNKEGLTPLMQATQRDNGFMATKLVEAGADLDIRDARGLNATMHAIYNKNIMVAEHLMRNGGMITDFEDPAVKELHVIAFNGGRDEYVRLANSQFDRERNRLDDLAKMTVKEICETGTAKRIKVRPIRLKGQEA